MKKALSLVLVLVMLLGMMPQIVLFAHAEEVVPVKNELAGKTISILGASISTYEGTSNSSAADTTNSTIRNNVKYYPHSVVTDVTLNDTWWMQVASDMGLRLLVNNSWSGSALLHTRNGTVGAYVDRCVQLHDNTGDNAGEEPDIIGIQMGSNDFQYYKDTLGTADIDYDALITENEDNSFTYATPVTSLEAAAIVLHKISVRYPNAEVYYLNASQRIDGTDAKSFNTELKKVVEHFGAHIVDIYGSVITPETFDTHIGDGRVHPNKLGMDAYTEAFKRTLLDNTAYEVDTHTVSLNLDGVTADYGDDKIVISGDSYTVNLIAAANMGLDVTVIMGGKDITATAYANGTVTVSSVSDDVTITAKSVYDPKDYRWEFDGTDLTCVNGGNALTKKAGTTTNGVFNKTCYALANEVVLLHNLPWSVEWKSEGTFMNTNGSTGARIFTSDDVNANYNARYIFKSATNWLIAMGEKDTKGSHNYGIALGDYGIDGSAPHTYRLENRIAADGSNMIYLFVDGEEIGPMIHYYVGTVDQNTTSNWLSGKDFVFPYMGTDTHGFTNASFDYLQVCESDTRSEHSHNYQKLVTAPTYTKGGYTTYTCSCGDNYTSDYTNPLSPNNYRWEFDGTDLACVSGDNTLTKNGGSTTNGVFSKTRYALENAVVLQHDLPWSVEWKSEGTFQNTNGSNGARVFTSDDVNANYNARYIFKSNINGLIAMGEKDANGVHNYGIALGDYGIDWTQLHTYRLENRIADDGSNMIYLFVDGEEIGPMIHYHVGSTDKKITSSWLSGKDFVFPYMGTDTHGFTNASIDYIQVWEGGVPQSGPVITQQPESVEQEVGKKFAITVKAEGEGLTYQWYVKEAGAKEFKVSVNKTSSYAYTMQTYMHNRQVYCVITDANGNSVQTETATITRPPQTLKILEQPKDAQQEIGQKFSISPKVEGEGLTYQWYVKESGAKAFKVSSVKGSAYALTMQKYMIGRQVYCVITDKYGNSVTTDVATISLPPVELKILEQPTDVYASKGEKFSISPKVQGEGLTYQWYYKEGYMKDFKPSSNKTSAYAYSMQTYMNERSVYCVITDKYGNQVKTEVVTIHLEK